MAKKKAEAEANAQNQVKAAQDKVDQVKAKSTEVQGRRDTAQTELSAATAANADAKTRADAASENVKKLREQLDAAIKQESDSKAAVDTTAQQIEVSKNKLTSVQAEFDAVASEQAEADKALKEALNTKVDFTAEIKKADDDVANANSNVATSQAQQQAAEEKHTAGKNAYEAAVAEVARLQKEKADKLKVIGGYAAQLALVNVQVCDAEAVYNKLCRATKTLKIKVEASVSSISMWTLELEACRASLEGTSASDCTCSQDKPAVVAAAATPVVVQTYNGSKGVVCWS